MRYRPWGQLPWLISRTEPMWSLVNCLSPERRCIAAQNAMVDIGCVDRIFTLDIVDPMSRFSPRANLLKEENRKLLQSGSCTNNYLQRELIASDAEIVEVLEHVASSGVTNLVCDISCIPKRFFFPFVKLLMRKTGILNLLITYTVPELYHTGILAEDHGPLQSLPLFGPNSFDDQVDLAVIGVGFVPLGLASLLEPFRDAVVPVELLFPFPPGPPFYQRNWNFIQEIRHTLAEKGSDPYRLHAVDPSTTFDHIVALCADGKKRAAFAPYGPKPISLAMCLYAMLNDCPVYYTQPKLYHPDYSSGIALHNGKPNINAYALRLANQDFYTKKVA